jgi:hypothetical protein
MRIVRSDEFTLSYPILLPDESGNYKILSSGVKAPLTNINQFHPLTAVLLF